MSCTIVSNECIADIIYLLQTYTKYINKKKNNEFGKELLNFNVEVYNSRHYNKKDILNYEYKPTNRHELAMLRSYRCYLYQCNEGKFKEYVLYKELNDQLVKIGIQLFNKYHNGVLPLGYNEWNDNLKYNYCIKVLDEIINKNNIECFWGV